MITMLLVASACFGIVIISLLFALRFAVKQRRELEERLEHALRDKAPKGPGVQLTGEEWAQAILDHRKK